MFASNVGDLPYMISLNRFSTHNKVIHNFRYYGISWHQLINILAQIGDVIVYC